MEFERMLRYLSALDKNNNRSWFHENHAWYDDAKADFIELLELLRFAIIENAPALADDLMYLPANGWLYRVARDMRYHKNDLPYNPSFRAYLSRDRKSCEPIGYFLRIAPGSCCFGTGLWCTNTQAMNRVRNYISGAYEEFLSIISHCRTSITGDKLVKMPRGYSDNHPAAEYLKFKSWSVIVDFDDTTLDTYENLIRYLGSLVKEMEPVRQFLLEASHAAPNQKQIFEDFYNI